MTNNDILRSLNYSFRLNEKKIQDLFKLVDQQVEEQQITHWLKREDETGYVAAKSEDLSNFLNGFIIDNRGKKSPADPAPTPNSNMNNNLVLKKLKIALNLQSDHVLEILKLADFNLSSHELTAFFRKEGHKNYRRCKNQVLRNFLLGLTSKYRKTN